MFPTERPVSALARGVQITEFKGNQINPSPVLTEESELLLDDYLSPRKLKDLTGVDDLQDVHFLEMKVDTCDTSLGNFGTHLPGLSQLKLSNSMIQSIRDLGSSLNNLKVLWMARCGLEDLDGLSTMNSLQELYLAYNEVTDLSPCSMLENLEILDLEGNNIDEISQVEFLALCQNLTNLTLEGNPVCLTPYPDQAAPTGYNYRNAVNKSVPQLKYLDDEPLLLDTLELKTAASVFDDDWRLIQELIDEGVGTSEESVEYVGCPNTTATPRPQTGYRPGSALKQLMNTGFNRPGSRCATSSTSRPSTSSIASRLNTSRPGSSGTGSCRSGSSGMDDLENIDDASDLTMGGVVCGNPSKALRARQKATVPTFNSANQFFEKYKYRPEHTYDLEKEEEGHILELMSELQTWKKQHQKKQKAIDATKVAQVLKIDHDDALSMSGNESVDSDLENDESFPVTSSLNPGLIMDSELHSYGHTPVSPGPLSPKTAKKGCVKSKTGSSVQSRRYKTSKKHEKPKLSPDYGCVLDGNVIGHDESRAEGSPGELNPNPRTSGLNQTSANLVDKMGLGAIEVSPGDYRPLSGPEVIGTRGKFKLEPVVDKTKPKLIDPNSPVIRASLHSPEQRIPKEPRASTSRAALGQPQLARMRKGQLAKVQLLPSKMPSTFNK